MMKLILKIKLIGEFTLEMTICAIDKKILKKNTNVINMTHINKNNNIIIWCFQDFIFDERQIRLPDIKNIDNSVKYKHKFKSDIIRKNILQKYMVALKSWSNDKKIFKNTMSSEFRFNGDFWIIN